MHSVGNDIVDLDLAKTQSNWQRKGFLEKQFTVYEQQVILNAKNSFLQVWLFWAMKEAAYKCYVQEHLNRFFAPKKFSCKILSNISGIVSIENVNYYINYTISNIYIHCVACKKKKLKMVSTSFFVDEIDLLNQKINNKLLANFPKNTRLKKSKLGVPYLFKNNKKLAVTISKSHHGNYGGFAYTLENDE